MPSVADLATDRKRRSRRILQAVNGLEQRLLNVEFLPSRRRFVIDTPFTVGPSISQLALTDRRLYLIDGANRLWIATLPAAPPGTSRR